MTERVIPLDIGVIWAPNVPDALLLSDDMGRAVLALNPHEADDDARCVVLTWVGVQACAMSSPNDEARHLHRLYECGLRELLWLGEVENSSWLASVAPMAARAATRHYVVLLKECTVEVLADELQVVRIAGSTSDVVSTGARRPA